MEPNNSWWSWHRYLRSIIGDADSSIFVRTLRNSWNSRFRITSFVRAYMSNYFSFPRRFPTPEFGWINLDLSRCTISWWLETCFPGSENGDLGNIVKNRSINKSGSKGFFGSLWSPIRCRKRRFYSLGRWASIQCVKKIISAQVLGIINT